MTQASTQAQRLARFIESYRAARSLPAATEPEAEQLASFLHAFRRLQPAPQPPRQRATLVGHDPLSALLTRLRGPLADARTAGILLNPWVMAGLRRNEVRNAAVLARFLSPRECGQLAVDFLDAILEPLRPHPQVPGRNELLAGYRVRTEHYAAGSERDRVDLTIEGLTFVIGIEVKIDAAEGPQQLERYVETIRTWSERRQARTAAVIFLAPLPAGRPDVLSINWRSIVAAARAVVAPTRALRPETQQLLHLFARHAAQFQKE